MADSDKLTALKKAYADVILNTAKEAAARIMASERKAQRYQRELFAAKDEALRMLLRLKQMLDSKVREAELTSLNQQRRIDELEAQLGEAEDIVKDLRTELRELHDELERLTCCQVQPLGEQNSGCENTTVVTALVDNGFSSSGSVAPSIPASQCDPVITLETKNSTLNGMCEGNKCYGASDCCKDNCFVCNPDFASIVMRSKEPELYRNGCTQRIRAFERNLLSLSGQADGVKNLVVIREDKEDDDKHKQLIAKVDSICNVERISDPVKHISRRKRRRNPSLSVHGVGIPASLKRKRAARYRRNRYYKSFIPEAVNNNDQTREDSRTSDNTSLEDPQQLMVPKSPSNTHEMVTQSESLDVTESEPELGRTCSFQITTNNDRLPIDELGLAGQEAGSAACSEFPSSQTDFEIASLLPSKTEAVSAHPQPLYKYTFQRKRKKESLSSPDVYTSIDNHILIKLGEKQSGSVDSDSSGLIAESSRDNQRLEQVAHQLISLSEKQWQ